MQNSNMLFYDNAEPEYDEHGRRFINRIYCFDWDKFTDGDWQELDRVYALLPSWLGIGTSGYSKGCPAWFDPEEVEKSNLSASAEPPGLEVLGYVTDDELAHWHTRFIKLTQNLPWRVIKYR